MSPPGSVDLRYDPRGQWRLEGDELREHLANERRRELELKQKREKKKSLYRQHVAARLANPEAEGRLHEYTEKQALRRRAKQEQGDTHIAGPTQAVRVSVYADVGIGRGDRPGRDWYEANGTGDAEPRSKKSSGVVFGSGIPAAAIRGTAPRDARGGRVVRRADYAPTLPRVAKIAVGDEQASEELGFNRHARKPAKKAAALANAALEGKGGGQEDESLGGAGQATAGARVQAMRSKGSNVRGAGKDTARDGSSNKGISKVRDDVMRRIRELEKSTRQKEGAYSAAMGAITAQLKSPGTIVGNVKDKDTATGLLEALREIAAQQHSRAVDAESRQMRTLAELADTRVAASTARAAAERVPGGVEVSQLRMDLATAKRTSAERLHKLNEALARLEITQTKLELLEAEKSGSS